MGDDERLSSLLRGEGSGTTGSEGSAADEGGDERGLRADNTRLRQRVVKLEELTRKATPFVDAIQRLSATALGKKVIEKLQKGENVDDLLPKEAGELEKQAVKAGVSKEDLEGLLQERDKRLVSEVTESMRISMDARDGLQKLHTWAEKELAGFDKIVGTPAWNGYLSAAQTAIREGTLQLPEGKDPYQELYRRVYNMCVAEDPDIVKGTKKAAPKEEKERIAEILKSSTKPSSSNAGDELDESKIPEEYKRQLDFIRGLKGGAGPTGVGLSFSNPARNKK